MSSLPRKIQTRRSNGGSHPRWLELNRRSSNMSPVPQEMAPRDRHVLAFEGNFTVAKQPAVYIIRGRSWNKGHEVVMEQVQRIPTPEIPKLLAEHLRQYDNSFIGFDCLPFTNPVLCWNVVFYYNCTLGECVKRLMRIYESRPVVQAIVVY